jgi:hypothetical protein
VLGLLALFTHIHAFWVAGLLLSRFWLIHGPHRRFSRENRRRKAACGCRRAIGRDRCR